MALLSQPIKLDELPVAEDYAPLPKGSYATTVKQVELKATKAATGHYLSIQLLVTGPTHVGRVVFDQLNIQNNNETAQRIGLEHLQQLMSAGSINELADTDQLIGVSCVVDVDVKHSEGYDPRNEVKRYKKSGGKTLPPATVKSPPVKDEIPW